jgi:Fe-S-cluster containining protein
LITLTKNDLIRIAFALGISGTDLLRAVDFHVLRPGMDAPIGLRDFPSIETEQGPAYLALKKLQSGECMFLQENRCMIHPVRPGVCKSFPFVFRKEKDQVFWGLSAKKEICPGIGKGDYVTTAELEALAEEVLGEQLAFREYVAGWNATRNSPKAADFILAILEDAKLPS